MKDEGGFELEWGMGVELKIYVEGRNISGSYMI